MKVLIIGGYGTFGGRLSRLLADDARLTLLIAGRSHDKAARFCREHQRRAKMIAVALDRDGNLDGQLAGLAPDLVVDASGPFQAYGPDPYRVAKTCLRGSTSYLDLADGSEFVDGIAELDADARRRGVFVLAGASTCPVLTVAVIRHLGGDLQFLDEVHAGIAPSPRAGLGFSGVAAIATQAGKPLKLRRGGREVIGHAMTRSVSMMVAPPGSLPLRRLPFSLVDVPDLRIVRRLWPDVKSVWFGAGARPVVVHRLLNCLSWLVRLKVLRTLAPLAPLFHRVLAIITRGEHRGCMFVAIAGRNAESETIVRTWHLVAEGDDGPFIPAMAAAAIILEGLEGRWPAPGARAAADAVTLARYERLFAERRIATAVSEDSAATRARPLYRRMLADAWTALPAPIQTMHQLSGRKIARGRADVERGRGLFVWLVCRLVGFPRGGADIPVEVRFDTTADRETWLRSFDGRIFVSRQWMGSGRSAGLLNEAFGPLMFGLALVRDGEKLRLVLRQWSLLGRPLPSALGPRIDAHESARNGRFCFFVQIALPIVGLIVRYRGWLAEADYPCGR